MIRVALLGAECTGKTTLVARLARHFKTLWVPEYARFYWRKKNNLTLNDVIPIMKGQRKWEKRVCAKAERQGKDFVICDTIPLSSLAYSLYYYGVITPEARTFFTPDYDLYLVTDNAVPWVDDPARDKQVDRGRMHQAFLDRLAEYSLPYSLIQGSWDERFAMAAREIEQMTFALSCQRRTR